jgi:hypothetical protein
VPAARRRQIARWVFLVLITLTLLATPLRSSFRWRAAFFCEVRAPIERWLAGALNLAHFIAYGVLMLVGAFVFHERRLAKSGALVFALSAVVELEQAAFTVGHCRVRDLLPNLMAIALGVVVCWAITRVARSPSPGR